MEKTEEKITWKKLKEFVNSIPEELLNKKASLLLEDETYARKLDDAFFIREDIYANKEDGEDCGTLEELKETHEHDSDFNLEDYILVTKKGTPFLYIS